MSALGKVILRTTRPGLLSYLAVLYLLGAGIAHYHGQDILPLNFILGFTWMLLFQVGMQFLHDFFRWEVVLPRSASSLPDENNPSHLEQSATIFRTLRGIGLFALAGAASLTMLMIVLGMLSPVTYLAMSLYVLSGLIYVLPITRFSDTGYGEILLTVLVAVMPPILSYLIRTGELHRFLPMLSFPVACSFLAFLLLDQFTHYSQDQLRGSKTMLSRMGWQTGLRFYYGLMISIYLFIALAVWFGLPIKIAWPACLSFPFALISTWQMGRMAEGAQPGWNLMKLTSQALCASLVYFFTLALWIN